MRNLEIIYNENHHYHCYSTIIAGVQPRMIQGVRSGDSVGEDQDTIASIRCKLKM